MDRDKLISEHYLDQLHQVRGPDREPMWGNSGKKHVDAIEKLLRDNKYANMLDYGCGHAYIIHELVRRGMGVRCGMRGYDPAMPQYSKIPELPFDMVVCTDVLEHIEPAMLDNVLEHIHKLTRKVAYLCVSNRLARTILPDGRNAHLIVEPPEWWEAKISEFFSDVSLFKLNEQKQWVAYLATP